MLLDHNDGEVACVYDHDRGTRIDEAESGTISEQCRPASEAEPAKVQPTATRSRLFLHDVALTMGAEAATVFSTLLLTWMMSHWLGAHALSEYLLLRRVLSWMVAATLLGLATGLPRYVAQASGRQEPDSPVYFLAASICMVPAAVIFGAIMVFCRAVFAEWFFGDRQEAGLIVALALLVVALSIHRAVYGYYRGLLDMAKANLLEFVNSALLPICVVVVLYRGQSVPVMMGAIGVLTAMIGALFAAPIVLRLRNTSASKLRLCCGELLRYGLPRIPGDFGAAALTALGPMLAAHYLKLTEVSPLLLGLNMLMVVGYAAGPLGVVLLSKVSMMLGRDQHDEVQARLRLLVTAVMEVSTFTCIQLAVFADVIVHAWVGPAFMNEMVVIRLVLLAIPPYLFFVTLRSTIDAITVKPYNTLNVLISLGTYVGLIAGWIHFLSGRSLLLGIAVSLLESQMLLGLLTARTFRKFYGLGVCWRALGPSFAAAAALGVIAIIFHSLCNSVLTLPQAVAAEAVITATYIAVLAARGSEWISYMWHRGIRYHGAASTAEVRP
jgi:O-antigen/teichoic acid export membrane protein